VFVNRHVQIGLGLMPAREFSMLLTDLVLFPIRSFVAWFWFRDGQQMEKFKACEKEMKTKAFSKEGLIQAAKLDPKEQEKEEATSWLQTQVEELQMQVEATEAEVEALQGTGKKRNKAGSNAAGRLEELETLNERRKWHISRLEIVLRLLNNGSMSPEKVFGLKEDVQYFVESNTVRHVASLFHTSRPFSMFWKCRKKTLMRMKVSMMTSISTRKKRSLAWLLMTTTPTTPTR